MTELAEGARLEIVCTLTGYRGFESPSLRQINNYGELASQASSSFIGQVDDFVNCALKCAQNIINIVQCSPLVKHTIRVQLIGLLCPYLCP